MSSKSRKRSGDVEDENRADCPFYITKVAAPRSEEREQPSKKRKRDGDDVATTASTSGGKKETLQISPFQPKGSFKSSQSMNLVYTIEPNKRWYEMTRYNSFVLNGNKYCYGDFVYVANEATIERQKKATTMKKNGQSATLPQTAEYWVAKLLEIRAADEYHVYARIYWMYSPNELPPGTLDGKKYVSGRQPYHGQNELIASNHMDVINVVSVATKAVMHQWIEADDDEVQDALYWRQAYNCRTSQLSSVELTCKCRTPANPDKTLIGCSGPDCGTWLHLDCLLHDILMQVYGRLGTDRPHISEKKETPVKVEVDATRPLTPAENKDEESTTPVATDTKLPLRHRNGHATPASSNHTESSSKVTTTIQTPTPGPSNSIGQRSAKSTSGKRGRSKKMGDKPYQGLFEASLRMNDGPMVWEITDLRPNIEGGERSWTERAACLLCQRLLD